MVGASLAGCGFELTLGNALDKLTNANVLPARRALTLTIVGGGGAFALAALVYTIVAWFRRRAHVAVERLHRLGRFVLPLSLSIFLPFLFRSSSWQTKPAKMLIFMGAFALVLEAMLRASFEATPAAVTAAASRGQQRLPAWFRLHVPTVVVVLAACGYAAYVSHFTLMHHQRLSTACYDLGQYDNLFYNAMVGHPFRLPSLGAEQDWTSLKGHAEIGMYVLLPFYTLKPGAETLLVIQATLLGTAALPLYLFGTRFVSRWTAMAMALAYLLYAPLHRANFYDFHMQPIAAAFVLWTLYFLVSKRTILFWIFFVLSLTMREDISIGLAVLGTFLIVTGYRPKTGAVMVAASITYFVVLKFGIMPKMGKWWFANIYKDLQIKGSKGYGSIVETLLSNPAYVFRTLLTEKKLAYALHILMPLAFLPIRKRYLVLAIVPGFFFTLLTTGYNPTVSVGFQYNAYYIPYVFPAALVALRVLGGQPADPDVAAPAPDRLALAKRRAAMGTVLVMSLVASYQYGAILQHKTFRSGFSRVGFTISDSQKQRYADLKEVVAQIPPGGSVAATEHLAPHVSARPTMYCFRRSINKAEYILVGPVDRSSRVRKTTTDLLKKNKVGLVAEKGGFYLLRLGEDPSKNQHVLKNWGHTSTPRKPAPKKNGTRGRKLSPTQRIAPRRGSPPKPADPRATATASAAPALPPPQLR